jgi:hypothetical protein
MTAQHNLIGYYASPAQAAARMRLLAVRAMGSARALPRGQRHAIILAAMAGNYLSSPEANAPGVRAISQSVREAIGDLETPTLLVFKLWRLARGAPIRRLTLARARRRRFQPTGGGARRRMTPARRDRAI